MKKGLKYDRAVVPLVTPLNAQGVLDEPALHRLLDRQIAGGVAEPSEERALREPPQPLGVVAQRLGRGRKLRQFHEHIDDGEQHGALRRGDRGDRGDVRHRRRVVVQ